MKKSVSSLFLQKKIQLYEGKIPNAYVFRNETETKCKMDQESYFYSNSSSNDDYINATKEIVEKTADNSFGRVTLNDIIFYSLKSFWDPVHLNESIKDMTLTQVEK